LTLLVVVAVGLLITRIGAVALMLTGLSQESARFQSLSAFMGVGFTTQESELVLEHPVRRRIIRLLILLGNAGFVAAVSSLVPIFVTADRKSGLTPTLLGLSCGLILLWVLASSRWVDRQMSRAIGWALKRWTRLDVLDYQGLLQIGAGYTVCEMKVEPGDWVAGKNLGELRLADEGVQVLGIRRTDGAFVGAPTGHTYIRRGDTLILYGKVELIAELDRRRADPTGDLLHQRHVEELQQAVEQEERQERSQVRVEDAAQNGQD
jgi:hypothetical protein